VFKCTESPKVTVEDWGVGELKGGVAYVKFSEEFYALISDTTEYAVFLTPEGECNGLYVSRKDSQGFEVRELQRGRSNVRFSWQVKAIRIGDENTPVVEEPLPEYVPPEPKVDEEGNMVMGGPTWIEWRRQPEAANAEKEEERLRRMKAKLEQLQLFMD
jgi:hypothetical protein